MRAAIKAGDFKQFRELYSSTAADPDQLLAMASQNYNTALKNAGHTKIIDFLIQQGAKPSLGRLIEAARDGSQEIIDRLLAGGAELDIFACALLGDATEVKRHLKRDSRLAQARIPAEIEKYRNSTPLHCCCLSALGRGSAARGLQFLEVGQLLVASGADVNAQGAFYGYVVTPVDVLAHTGGNIALVQFLIANGGQISTFAFIEALAHRGRSDQDGLKLAQLFLESGFDINAAPDGRTALHASANSGSPSVVKWLLERGADVNVRGQMGRTPLHVAAERNSTSKIVEILVAHGADIEAKDGLDQTPLQIAEHHGKAAVARWLKNT